MYQVFYKKKFILLTDVIEEEKDFLVFPIKNVKFKKVIKLLEKKNTTSVRLYHKNKDKLLKYFFKLIPTVIAAGGKIINSKSETLFIYRNDKWDLPKGHIEIGEDKKSAAIREVEEECGVAHLNIEKKLETTFHIFQNKKGALCLKVVYWFLMRTSFSGTLKPQLEEGITRVQFFDHNELSPILQKTYGNIKLLF